MPAGGPGLKIDEAMALEQQYFTFNLMVAGVQGMGKSVFLKSLFAPFVDDAALKVSLLTGQTQHHKELCGEKEKLARRRIDLQRKLDEYYAAVKNNAHGDGQDARGEALAKVKTLEQDMQEVDRKIVELEGKINDEAEKAQKQAASLDIIGDEVRSLEMQLKALASDPEQRDAGKVSDLAKKIALKRLDEKNVRAEAQGAVGAKGPSAFDPENPEALNAPTTALQESHLFPIIDGNKKFQFSVTDTPGYVRKRFQSARISYLWLSMLIFAGQRLRHG